MHASTSQGNVVCNALIGGEWNSTDVKLFVRSLDRLIFPGELAIFDGNELFRRSAEVFGGYSIVTGTGQGFIR